MILLLKLLMPPPIELLPVLPLDRSALLFLSADPPPEEEEFPMVPTAVGVGGRVRRIKSRAERASVERGGEGERQRSRQKGI